MIASLLLGLAASAGADCKHIGSSLVGLALSQSVVRPGDRLTLHFYYRDGPDGEKDIPKRCVKDFAVTGPARIARDGAIEIGGAARSGDTVTLSMRIGDSAQRRTIRITGRDEQVLTGKWRPVSSENCQGRIPAEIVFGDEGRYSFTFAEQMVETMVSGGGSYSWDPATGALVMGWSPYPTKARFEGDRLVLEGVVFDPVPPPLPGEPVPPPCRLVLG